MPRLSAVRILVGAALALVVAVVVGQEKKDPQPKMDKPAAKAVASNPGFEKLKQLAGEWVEVEQAAGEKSPPSGAGQKTEPGKQGEKPEAAEKPHEKEAGRATVIYKVTADGSAVAETLFPGTPHEMITMYYLDGPDLVLTHYCAAHNQPHMKAEKSADESKLVFQFAGGSNIDPAKDAHMHSLTLTFVSADQLRADWTSYAGGKSTGVKTFEFKRKQP